MVEYNFHVHSSAITREITAGGGTWGKRMFPTCRGAQNPQLSEADRGLGTGRKGGQGPYIQLTGQ